MKARLLICALLLALVGCGKDPETSKRTYSDLASSLEDARRESVALLGSSGEAARAAWDQTGGNSGWSNAVMQELAIHRATLEKSRDLDDFCPGYIAANSFQKDTCWLRLFSAMARFESNFKPSATFVEANGRTSVGLLMMNPDHCPAAPSIEKLMDPLANIHCAAHRLAILVFRDSAISGEGNTGGAAYWSTLRAPYTQGAMLLGRKPHIQFFTRTYKGFSAP